jgi:hypothetical protein
LSYFFKKYPKYLNSHPIGENSPNLVALIEEVPASPNFDFTERKRNEIVEQSRVLGPIFRTFFCRGNSAEMFPPKM